MLALTLLGTQFELFRLHMQAGAYQQFPVILADAHIVEHHVHAMFARLQLFDPGGLFPQEDLEADNLM